MYKKYTKSIYMPHGYIHKLLRIMRLTTIILIVTFMQVSATSLAQRVTIIAHNAPLESILKEIRKQTGYDMVFDRQLILKSSPVDLVVKNVKLEDALTKVVANQPLSFTIEDKTIIIKEKAKSIVDKVKDFIALPIDVTGRVLGEHGTPMPGVTVTVKGTNNIASTDDNGYFTLRNVDTKATIILSEVGFEKKEIAAAANLGNITIIEQISKLDEVQVIAYGTTTQRLATGDIGKISGAEIEQQLVSNPLAALEGKIPGLIVTQTTGIPGGTFKVQIRGQNSITQGSDPLFVIDGIPFATNNSPISQAPILFNQNINRPSINTQPQGLSPFNTLNPSDIESIEILKDADATSIYGSRGSNGVVLITTKKGKAGKTKVTASVNTGASVANFGTSFLNTVQYLQYRSEAFKNDGITPDQNSAPDLTVWDQNKYTNFQKLLAGKTADNTNAQLSLSGGNDQTQFLISTGFNRQSTVFPGDYNDKTGSIHFNINHSSVDKKFSLIFSGGYAINTSNLPSSDPSFYITSAPNYPNLTDNKGNLIWSYGGYSLSQNPLAYLKQLYSQNTNTLTSSMLLNYQVLSGLTIRVNLGYNMTDVDETNQTPILSQNPLYSPLGASNLYNSKYNLWNIEPQLEYRKRIGKGLINLLIGSTLQNKINKGSTIYATGFTNDNLLADIAAAPTTYASNNYSEYRYEAYFARLNFNLIISI